MKSLRRSLNNNHHSHGHGHSNSHGGGHIASPTSTNIPMTNTAGFAAPGAGPATGPPGFVSPPAGGAPVNVNGGTLFNPLSRPSDKVAPPKKVIKALHSHRSTNPQELSYQKGDFWYVTGEREGWYEALNPLTGSRGLVPKDDFEEFVKGGRQAAAAAGHPARDANAFHAPPSPRVNVPPPLQPETGSHMRMASSGGSGRAESGGGSVRSPGSATTSTAATTPTRKNQTQPLYAIVQYDFHAERPDELEAKAGEPIVVIAQSNHEWFVAKPIGRLGGPGLIPVTFVEIRDPVSGRPVNVIPTTIPQVEEWKKATAEYKAAAIPLGRLDLPPDQRVPNSPYAAAAQAASLGAQGQQQTELESTSPSEPHHAYSPEQDPMLPAGELIKLSVPSFHNESGNYWFRLQIHFVPDDRNEPAYMLILYRTYEDFYDFQITLLDTFPVEAGRSESTDDDGTPPPRILPYMPGPVDEQIDDELTEYRREELDAYVKALLDLRAAGAAYILRHELVRTFFAAKYGDYCEEKTRADYMEELQAQLGSMTFESGPPSSSTSAAGIHHLAYGTRSGSESSHPEGGERQQPYEYGQQRSHARGPSLSDNIPHASMANHTRNPSQQTSSTAQTVSPGQPTGYGGIWAASPSNVATSTIAEIPPSHSQPSVAQPESSQPAAPTAQPPIPPAARPVAQQPAFVKVKIYDRSTDDLIALRVHPTVSYSELLDKVRARLGPEINVLQYRVGNTTAQGALGNGHMGNAAAGAGAPQRAIRDDRDLAEWMASADHKLVLYAEQHGLDTI